MRGCLLALLTTCCLLTARSTLAQQTLERTVSVDDQLAEMQQRLNAQDREITHLRSELEHALDQHRFPPLPLGSPTSTTGFVTLQNPQARNSPPEGNGGAQIGNFSNEEFTNVGSDRDSALNLNTYSPIFDEGIVISSDDIAMKIGGYVKVDVIHDFQPVGNKDSFATQTILVNVPQRENSRLHARQSRLNFDTRWRTDLGVVRAFVEGDFFSAGNGFRLRHAYGEAGNLIVGQTWSTFANVDALPSTLDFEGSASVISQRQGQVRWTQDLIVDGLSFSLAVEDPELTVTSTISMLDVEPLTESPDVVGRFLFKHDQGNLQLASVLRSLGLITPNGTRVEASAWGLNFSGTHEFTESDRGYAQIIVGEGIGSYKGIPDVVSDGISRGGLLPVFGWMVGWNHRWTDRLQSNLTYSENILDNPSYQPGEELHKNTYFATNLIWSPAQHFFTGIEYLYGTRENVNGDDAEAHRLQTSFGFYLP